MACGGRLPLRPVRGRSRLRRHRRGTALEGERARLLEHWLRDFRRAGHELGADERAELERLRTRLVEVEVAFQRNLNEYRDGIDVTREQLAGLPDAYVERLSPGEREGTYRVSLDYPEVNPFLEQAHDRDLRRELFHKNWNKAVAANRPLLDEALDLRRRVAVLLGHPTWAHHAMEVKMARTPERVADFYEELLPPLAGRVRSELEGLGEGLQAEATKDRSPPGTIATTTTRCGAPSSASTRTKSASTSRSKGARRHVRDQRRGAGVRGQQRSDSGAWHESVRLYEIRDRASEAALAHFYADLHPREGKFGHAAAFPLVVGHRSGDGSWITPVSAILANFTPPSGDTPALLKHSEVKTLFHEFGHILHMSLTRAEFARFSAGETEWDFVEAPSQIMEHWTWDASVLERFARHYETDEVIPAELVDQMLRARWVDEGIRIGVQAFYGGIDLALHAEADAPDVDAALRRTYTVTGMPYPEGTFMLAGFGHLLGGYDAGYYGYLWAEVIGDDMFGRFAREGVLRRPSEPIPARDPRAERLPRRRWLVRAFLGREPSNAEFLRLRGMK